MKCRNGIKHVVYTATVMQIAAIRMISFLVSCRLHAILRGWCIYLEIEIPTLLFETYYWLCDAMSSVLCEGVLKKRSQYLPVWRSRFFVLHGVTGELSSAANGETDRQTKAKSTSGNSCNCSSRGGSAHHKGRDDSLSSASSASARLGLRSSSLKGSQARLLPCILCYRREGSAQRREAAISDVYYERA